ncbi:MAG TPA: glycosyl hydrolase family 79 C-terminal domain-containing protein [Solirubrobacteraceae bacterium]|jgi:hypothetical protein
MLGAAALMVAAAAVLIAPSNATVPRVVPANAQLVDVTDAAISRPIAAGFVGLSIEYPSSLAYSGANPASPNPTFIRLVEQLNPSGSPVIRFGGDTTDWTWWPTPVVEKPPGIRYALTPRWLAVTRATALALHARLILGINLEADSAIIARAEARALLKGIGRSLIMGFELGNEPEVYGSIDWYTTHAGVGVRGRPARYGFRSYLIDYAAIRSALPRTVPLVGPASGAPRWTPELNRYLAANPRVRIVTFHRYPLHRCFTARGASTYPTIPNLLARRSTRGPGLSLRAAARVAHAHGLTLRADELNSVSCGGARGVSNTFASALWVLDTMFNLAAAGVDGVNIHTFRKALYAPFSFMHASDGWQAHVDPMYYGMLMFARAAPAGSRLLSTRAPSSPALRIWAVRAPDRTVRVTAINDSPTRTLVLAVRPPHTSGAATLERLTAPSLGSGTGVTIAGQTFGASTTTGKLVGSDKTTTLQPIQHRYVVELPPASAALLSLRGS